MDCHKSEQCQKRLSFDLKILKIIFERFHQHRDSEMAKCVSFANKMLLFVIKNRPKQQND